MLLCRMEIRRIFCFKLTLILCIMLFYEFIFKNVGRLEKEIVFEDIDLDDTGMETHVEFQKCLRKLPPDNQSRGCRASYKRSCLTQRIPPLWQVSIFRVRSCFECCVRFWMKSLSLSENENFWINAAKTRTDWMFADRFTDWRFAESVIGHSEGEILLGQMSFPLLADVAVFPKGNYAKTKKVNIIQANRNFSQLNRAVVLVSGCAYGVRELLEWMTNNLSEYNVTLFTRDDEEIGRKELFLWKRFIAMRKSSSIWSTWYIMNSNLNLSTMKRYNIRTFPLGIKFPVGYLAGLKKLQANTEYDKRDRSKLLSCSSMKFSYSDRVQMRQDLEGNGFNCHEGERYGSGNELPLKKRKALNRKQQCDYVESLSSSFFFASPEGNGRDCYRHLEGVTAGSILLARNFKRQDTEKFQGLPVLNVRSWKEVTKEKLLSYKNAAYSSPENFDLKRGFLPWWLSQIILTD